MKKILFWLGSIILFAWALAFFVALFSGVDACTGGEPVPTHIARFALFAPFIGLGLQWLGKKKD